MTVLSPGSRWGRGWDRHQEPPLLASEPQAGPSRPHAQLLVTTQAEGMRGSLRLSGICALHLALQTGEQTDSSPLTLEKHDGPNLDFKSYRL